MVVEVEHPLWLGSVRPLTSGVATWRDAHDRELRRIVEAGRPLILIGRNSGSSGRAGAREAAKNLHEAARGLARRAGFDVTSLVPSVSDLVELLMASPNVKESTDGTGRTFRNRFCLLDFSDQGVIVSFSTGSAHKVDKELKQPHVQWVQRLMHELDPAGFFASQFNRVSRVVWQTGLLVEELRALELRAGSVWACDDQYGMWSTSQDSDVMHAVRGQQASAEAKAFRKKTEQSQLAQTGEVMVDGRVEYALSGGVPPGFFSYRDRLMNRMMLSIDSPGYYPDPNDVHYGLPDVRDASNELVDQAETVRWFLREYAKPGVSVREVFKGLVERRFSTHALRLRRDQGPAAYYGGPTKPVATYASDACNSWVRSIFDNLELYETGLLRRSVGAGDHLQIVISGAFPDAGFWASPDDFSRIREKVAADRRRSEATHKWSWSAMPVLIDGVPGQLKPRRSQVSADDVAWTLYVPPARPSNTQVAAGTAGRGSDAGGAGRGGDAGVGELAAVEVDGAGVSQDDADAVDGVAESVPGGAAAGARGRRDPIPAIPDRLLTASIVEALVRADGRPLTPHLAVVSQEDPAADARRELEQSRTELSLREAALERCYELVTGGQLANGLLARVQSDYEQCESDIKQLNRRVESAQRRVDAVVATRVGVDVTAMSALVAGLRDPHDNRYRADLRDAVHGLSVTTTRVVQHGLKGTVVDVSGLLLFDVDGRAYELPFGFTYRAGAAFEVGARALKALASLRAGRVARYVQDGATHDSSVLVADLLGVDSCQFALSACHDSRLLALGMAAVFPDPTPGEDPSTVPTVADLCADPGFVADFGDVAGLAEHMRDVYRSLRGRQWLRVPGGRYETRALLRVAKDNTPVPAVDAEEMRQIKFFKTNVRTTDRATRWTFPAGSWPVIDPCSFCGSTAAASMRIREVRGYVCLDPACRRDEAGVRWPARFDQYMTSPLLWVAAGVELTLPDGFDPAAKGLRGEVRDVVVSKKRKWRQLGELDRAERAAVAAGYADRSRTVKEIMTTFGIGPDTLYDIIAVAGLQPRNAGRAKWQDEERAIGRTQTAEQRRAARRPTQRDQGQGGGRAAS